jgi:hypothetical protein
MLRCRHIGDSGAIMSSQQVTRRFHRLAALTAAIPLLLGIIYSLCSAYQTANDELIRHHKVVCAREHAGRWPPVTAWSGDYDVTASIPLNLKSVGCSDRDDDTVSFAEARNPPEFNWWGSYARQLVPFLALTAAISLSVYGVVRALDGSSAGLRPLR